MAGGLLWLTWLQAARLARSWRWRVLVLLALAGAWWFSRFVGFWPGAPLWFPAGPDGVAWFALFIAAASVVLGVEQVAQWDRARGRALLENRLGSPGRFLGASLLAIVPLALVPAAIIALWTPIGAWRADLVVLWTPNLLWLVAAALPLAVTGAAAGLLARVAVANDLGALALGWLLAAPAAALRVWGGPAREFFELASASLGLLVPPEQVLAEAAALAGVGAMWFGLAVLLLPRPRPATVVARPGWRGWLQPRLLVGLVRRVDLRRRQLEWGGTVTSLIFLSLGGMAAVSLPMPPPRLSAVDWLKTVEPNGLTDGRIMPLRLLERRAEFPASPEGRLVVELDVEPVGSRMGALTFGPMLEPATLESDPPGAVWRPTAGDPAAGIHVVALPPGDGAVRLRIELARRPGAERLWRQCWHPRYHRFTALGVWWGESPGVDYAFQEIIATSQESPWSAVLPVAPGLTWAAGSARGRETGDGRIELRQPRRSKPYNLTSGDFREVRPTRPDVLPVVFRVLPSHESLAAQLQTAWASSFERLLRLFGPPPEEIVVAEVPEATSTDLLTIPSATLDRLQLLLPMYDHFETPTRSQFDTELARLHAGLLGEIFSKRFSRIEEPWLLGAPWAMYLHEHGLERGVGGNMGRRIGRDVVLMPYEMRPARLRWDLSIRPSQREAWRGPLNPDARGPQQPPPDPRRAMAVHHLLRYHLGDEAYVAVIRRVFTDRADRPLALADVAAAVVAETGKSVDDLLAQWVDEGVVPALRVRQGEAFLIEDKGTRALSYRVEVVIANTGTGRMEFPWMLVTEGESIEGKSWLEPGGEARLSIPSLDRPVAFELDPFGWIPQELPTGADGKGTERPRLLFRTIREI